MWAGQTEFPGPIWQVTGSDVIPLEVGSYL